MQFHFRLFIFCAIISQAFSFSLKPSSAVVKDILSSNSSGIRLTTSVLLAKLSDKRKKELGVADDEDEYDLSQALNANTDPLITKLIAGSLIVVIIGLLVVAVIIPLTSGSGDGLCNPILNSGRC